MKNPHDIINEIIQKPESQNDLIFLMGLILALTVLVALLYETMNPSEENRSRKKVKKEAHGS